MIGKKRFSDKQLRALVTKCLTVAEKPWAALAIAQWAKTSIKRVLPIVHELRDEGRIRYKDGGWIATSTEREQK